MNEYTSHLQFIDLVTQQSRIREKIDSAIANVLDHGQYIMGPEVKKFEEDLKNFTESKHVLSCANGTDAITLALFAHDISSGYVITPSHTAPASILGIINAGCKPLFVDVDSETALICINEIEEKLRNKPNIRAILAVHLYGNGINMPKLNKVARSYNCIVVEDCAQSAGTKILGKYAGTFSDAGTFSFFPTKNSLRATRANRFSPSLLQNSMYNNTNTIFQGAYKCAAPLNVTIF